MSELVDVASGIEDLNVTNLLEALGVGTDEIEALMYESGNEVKTGFVTICEYLKQIIQNGTLGTSGYGDSSYSIVTELVNAISDAKAKSSMGMLGLDLKDIENVIKNTSDPYSMNAQDVLYELGMLEDFFDLVNGGYSEEMWNMMNSIDRFIEYFNTTKLPHAATGGIVREIKRGGDDTTAAVKIDETILTDKFTDMLPDAVNIMSEFNDLYKKLYSVDLTKQQGGISYGDININYTMNVEGSIDAAVVSDMDKFKKDVVDETERRLNKAISRDLNKRYKR